MANWRTWFYSEIADHPYSWYPLFSLLAMDAYENAENVSTWVDLQGAEYQRFTSPSFIQATCDVYKWDYGIVLAFKGTDAWAQIRDYVLKHDIAVCDWHQIPIYEISYLYFNGIRTALQAYLADKKDLPITLVGHSLGGSLAKIAASFLKSLGCNVKNVLTFGTPRFESREFIDQHRFPCFCIENARDPVPYMPTRAFYSINKLKLLKFPFWAPRKYGKMSVVNCNLMDYVEPQYANYFMARRWNVDTWEGGNYDTWYYGDEPDILFGIPRILLNGISSIAYATRFPFSRVPPDTQSYVHSSKTYVYMVSALCQDHFKRPAHGVVPGHELFKSLNPWIFYNPNDVNIPARHAPPDLTSYNIFPTVQTPAFRQTRQDFRKWIRTNYTESSARYMLAQDLIHGRRR